MKIIKVISGGQTGADQAGLFAAKECGIPTGGTTPKGWRTQKGPAPWLAEYDLVEHSSAAYQPRTKRNVIDSNITLVFGNPNSPGCKLTRKYCEEVGRPFVLIKQFDQADLNKCLDKLHDIGGELIINIAGNREESSPGIEQRTTYFLKHLFRELL